MKTVFFESLYHKLITKNDFYYGSCHVIQILYQIGRLVPQHPFKEWRLNGTNL